MTFDEAVMKFAYMNSYELAAAANVALANTVNDDNELRGLHANMADMCERGDVVHDGFEKLIDAVKLRLV